jgi:dTDP-glucose 4,6-dehydratase
MDDVSYATWQIAQNAPVGETYHISTDRVISIRALVESLCELLDVSFEKNVKVVGERLGKDSAYWLSSEKIHQDLGWKDQISLEQGLEQTIDWVQKNLQVLKTQPMQYIHKK